MQEKRTKIIATVGPASSEAHTIGELIDAGVDIFRFNMKHGTFEWHEEMIAKVQKVADTKKVVIGIMIDLQGPEIRIKTGQDILVKKGDTIDFVYEYTEGERSIGVKNESFFSAMKSGDRFSIDDGFVEFEVVKKSGLKLKAIVFNDGIIGNNKGLNLIEKDLDVPSLVEDDIKKLDLATRREVDFVALSFVRSREDILALKKVMSEMKIDAGVVSKVESKRGLDNIDEIIEESAAVMVARGDLGIEVPIEQLTYHQKEIIRKCRAKSTPVIVATQMLESMIVKPTPSRAEATDIANAVFDGTDAMMLSGETAMGKYPVRAVREMTKMIKYNEVVSTVPELDLKIESDAHLVINAASILAKTAELSESFNIDYIVAVTESGTTARFIASYRPKLPIIALTPSVKTMEKLKMSYGVKPVLMNFVKKGELIHPDEILNNLKKAEYIKKDQLIMVVHGQRKDIPGKTNSIVLMRVN